MEAWGAILQSSATLSFSTFGSPLFVRLPTTCPFSLLYSRVYTRTHFHSPSLSSQYSTLLPGGTCARRILRNSMEIARVPETALERISRHRVSQRRTPRLDIPIRYTAGTWGAHCETHRNRGRDSRPRAVRPSQRKKEKERFLRRVTRFRPVIGKFKLDARMYTRLRAIG